MNPFKNNGEILPVASINSVYVDDIMAYNIFRPAIILQDIIDHKDQLGITNVSENMSLLTIFNSLLNHELESVRNMANDIAEKYGNRLARILGTLYKPSFKSISNRENWTQEHWDYWKTIRKIYLVGGLTSPILTKIFYNQVMNYFSVLHIDDVQISFIEGSQNLGTSGLSTLLGNGNFLLFDFGQTSIKRAHHMNKHERTIIESILEPVESKFLFYKTTDQQEILRTALLLDEFIIETILSTMNEVAYNGDTIYMSIANYISKGVIYGARGGYGKLSLIAANYQEHLQYKLSKILQRDVTVYLFHDTSAMAFLFKDEPHTAVISLGTAFGVAFP